MASNSPQLSTIVVAVVVGYILYVYYLKPGVFTKDSDETFVGYQPLKPDPLPITSKTQVFPSHASVSNRVNSFSKGPGFPIMRLKPSIPPVGPKINAAAVKPAIKKAAKSAIKTAASSAKKLKLSESYPIVEFDNSAPVQPGR